MISFLWFLSTSTNHVFFSLSSSIRTHFHQREKVYMWCNGNMKCPFSYIGVDPTKCPLTQLPLLFCFCFLFFFSAPPPPPPKKKVFITSIISRNKVDNLIFVFCLLFLFFSVKGEHCIN